MNAKKTDVKIADMPFSLLQEGYALPSFQKKAMDAILKLCGKRPIDLLLHLPTKVMDRSQVATINSLIPEQQATLLVKVLKHTAPRFRKGRLPYKILIADDSGEMELVFFHYGSWLQRAFPLDSSVIISGVVQQNKKKVTLVHPSVWPAGRGLEDVAKVWPLYRLTQGMTHTNLKRAIDIAYEQIGQVPEWLPQKILAKHTWQTFSEALAFAHNPTKEADTIPRHPSRMRLAFDELYAHQLAITHARNISRKQPGIAHSNLNAKQLRFTEQLPFQLTNDQQAALEDIHTDLSADTPMLRLLQGDVGSGKTVVAFLALLRVIENGCQGLMMAPTEILAQQHFESAQKLFQPLGINVALLTGSVTTAAKKKLKQHIKDGIVHLVIGTHALTQDTVKFDKLGLAVVDEQHRFGVKQRLALTQQSLPPDVLIMTATPIPRTLALTFYGDMDTSIIQEKPPGRTPIETRVMAQERLVNIAHSLNRVIEKNEQIYWVCPLVEDSEKSDLTAAKARYETLHKIYGNQVALLHGKIKSADKTKIMTDFKAGKYKILVSTTVIEVGMDVPQATVMIIEHAERFGLSQLHQLRGRVGRGSAQSSCILLYQNPMSEYASERLQAMKDSDDGFYLAEKDLELRGPGEVLGTKQSGEIHTKIADLYHHKDLIPLARELAEKTLSSKISAKEKEAMNLLLKIFNRDGAEKLLSAG